MTDYDKIVLIVRRALGIAADISDLVSSLYKAIIKTVDLNDSFIDNKNRILDLFRGINLKPEFEAKMESIALATVAANSAIKPVRATKALINDALNNIMPESNLSTYDLIDSTLIASKRSVINNINQGIQNGWTNKQLTAALSKGEAALEKNIKTIAITATNAVSNETKARMYAADDTVDRVLFSAFLDSRTSDICKNLDAKVFKKEDAPQPPMHPNCRSAIVSIMVGESAEEVKERLLPRPSVVPKNKTQYEKQGLYNRNGKVRKPSKTDRSPLKGEQTYSVDYEDWLRKQPKYYQEDIIGIKGTKAFRSGSSLKEVTNIDPITEEHLKQALN